MTMETPRQRGVALGGASGLAVRAGLAAARTESALAGGAVQTAALAAGYRLAFVMGAMFAAAAAAPQG